MDTERISEVVDNQLFKAQVERATKDYLESEVFSARMRIEAEKYLNSEMFAGKVASATRTYLKELQSYLIPLTAVLALVCGLWGYSNVKDLHERADQAKKDVQEDFNKELAQFDRRLSDYKTDSEARLQRLSSEMDGAQGRVDKANEVSTSAEAQANYVEKKAEFDRSSLQNDFDKASKTLDVLRGEQADADKRVALAQKDASDAQHTAATVSERVKNIDADATKTQETFKTEINTARFTTKRFLEVTQSQILALHSEKEQTTTVYASTTNPSEHHAGCRMIEESGIEECEIRVYAKHFKPLKEFEIRATACSQCITQAQLVEGAHGTINGTPFDYEVVFLYHPQVAAHRMAMIKIRPHSSPAILNIGNVSSETH